MWKNGVDGFEGGINIILTFLKQHAVTISNNKLSNESTIDYFHFFNGANDRPSCGTNTERSLRESWNWRFYFVSYWISTRIGTKRSGKIILVLFDRGKGSQNWATDSTVKYKIWGILH